MGAWDELDTEFTVIVELDDLDKINDLDDPYGIFETVQEYCANLKEAVDYGSKLGIKDLAGRNRSFQEQIILASCKNPSGMLASSINDEQQDDYTYLVGTIINHIYPMCLEFGRGPVYPIRAKALAFYADSGELIFRKSVGPAKPVPFVAPAYDKADAIAEQIMLAHVGQEMSKVK